MRCVRAIAAAGRDWRWWSAAALLELALALPPALLWREWLRGAIGGRFEPGELFANLTTSFRFDHSEAIGLVERANANWLGFAALAAMLAGMFLAGGWAQLCFDGGQGAVMARGLGGGRRFFARYLRVCLGTLVLLALWSWVMFDAPWKTIVLGWILRLPESRGDRLEAFVSEWSAVIVRCTQAGLYALGVAFVLCCADYVRLRIAWRDARSVAWEWLAGLGQVARRPWRALRPLLALFVVEALLVSGASVLARGLEGRVGAREAGLGAVLALALLTAAVLALRCWLRGARYRAAAEIVAADVAPLPRPFAWRRDAPGEVR